MIDMERFDIFVSGYEADLPEDLEELYHSVKESGLPVIRRALFPLLRFILKTARPSHILEVGTGYGFSSLFMWKCLQPGGVRIDTIEAKPVNAGKAKDNIETLGAGEVIRVITGDAGEILDQLEDGYDLIFIDGPKGQYTDYFHKTKRLLNNGGILIADNVMADGDMLKSRYALERRQRTIHERMRGFLEECFGDGGFETVILPVADGVSISVKKDRKAEEKTP